MATAVMMPQVGQDIETAVIVEWLKKENDPVQKGDVIATVESDKATFDVEAYESGVLLKILHAEGAEVPVLTPIAYIGQPGEEVVAEAPPSRGSAQHEAAQNAPTAAEPARKHGGAAASPSARRVAKEKGVDLEKLTGTGPGGRITKEDVLKAAEASVAGVPPSMRGPEALDTRGRAPPDTGIAGAGTDEVVPFSPMRAKIAERLTRSKQTIPHFTLFADIDMTEALAWRRQFNENHEVKVTVNDMVVKAVAGALKDAPELNAHVGHDKIILKKDVNIGVAVSVKDGLAVPVIADADMKSLSQISEESRRNAEAIREGKLLSNAPGSFTVSNLGMYAVDMFLPIINPPECAILALGQAAERPAVVGGAICVRSIMTAALACDHRAVDGSIAAKFLETLKQRLENPASTFME